MRPNTIGVSRQGVKANFIVNAMHRSATLLYFAESTGLYSRWILC